MAGLYCSAEPLPFHKGTLPRVLFFNINGSGVGHMSRCLAYARRLRDRAECVFFSLASAIELIEAMGFEADYFVSPNWSCATAIDWNRELCVRFGMMLERVRPDVVVFDGTWPYRGFVQACKVYGKAPAIWSNRGLHLEGKSKVSVDASMFELIIQPGELGTQFSTDISEYGCRQFRVPPVCLLDAPELMGRVEARQALGLEIEGRYVLFSLGAGNINEVGDLARGLMQRVRSFGYIVVWACNPISVKDVELPDGVLPVSVYPLVRYLRAFDAFIGAAGYNTCCEVVQAQVPALLVPNMNTKLDDQYKRASIVARHAPAVVSVCATEDERADAVGRLLEIDGDMTYRELGMPMNGAALVADEIMMLARKGNAFDSAR